MSGDDHALASAFGAPASGTASLLKAFATACQACRGGARLTHGLAKRFASGVTKRPGRCGYGAVGNFLLGVERKGSLPPRPNFLSHMRHEFGTREIGHSSWAYPLQGREIPESMSNSGSPAAMRWVTLHLEIYAVRASIQQRDQPGLKGMPVIFGSSLNQQGGGVNHPCLSKAQVAIVNLRVPSIDSLRRYRVRIE